MSPAVMRAHKLETGQAVLTLSPDRVWILEMDINLSRYIQSNPEFAGEVRSEFGELEEESAFTDANFDRWEAIFSTSEDLFRSELTVYESGEIFEQFDLWFPHPSELPEIVYQTMVAEGLHIKVFSSGRLTSEESELQFRFPLDIGEVVMTVMQPDVQWVVTGELSEPITFAAAGMQRSGSNGFLTYLFRYIKVGFVHIVPGGLDHILFVLGLFLLAAKMRPLLIQVTAFTVAHTLTLGLSIYGLVSLPSTIVEPLIALSIALVAIENVLTDSIRPWRPVVVFFFGLLHGLGFAGVLAEIGLPPDKFLAVLVSFNIGVELGQLMVLASAFIMLGFFRKRDWYRSRITIPASCLIGVVGSYWTVERLFF